MSVSYSSKPVKSGLILYLDAGNSKSYPGSGTTWYDLSGANNNATLINGPTYNSSQKGYFSFDGINDYLSFNGISLNTNTGFTVDLWIYIIDPQTIHPNLWAYWFSNSWNQFEWGTYASVAGQGKFVFKDSGAVGSPQITSSYVGNAWANLVFGCNATVPFMYINTVLGGTTSNFRNTSFTITNLLRAQDTLDKNHKSYHSIIKMYSKALSASEVLQNFNAVRGRYGI